MPGKTQALTQDMSLPNPVEKLSEADYLRLERAAQFKSQFYDGEMFAMSGGTRWHSLITGNLIRELGTALKKQKCLVYDSNMRVKVEATGLYTYPDVVVAGNDQRFLDGVMDTLLNPSLLIEVLSESTEAYDRGKKFIHYRRIPSLNEYLLVSQTEPVVEQFHSHRPGRMDASPGYGIGCSYRASITRNYVGPLRNIFENRLCFRTGGSFCQVPFSANLIRR